MKNIETDIGKIFCRYNESTDDFTMMRLIKIEKCEVDEKLDAYVFGYLDENFNLVDCCEVHNKEEFKKIKKTWTVLKSDGIVSMTNIVAASTPNGVIKDVLAIYFPNNKVTQVPDVTQPYVIARQGIDNLFASMAGVSEAGMAVSLNTMPAGYAISDFMANDQVLSSYLCHVYKTDTEHNLSILLENDTSEEILLDLYDHAIRYNMNTIIDYKHEEVDDDCVNGYSNSIKAFLVNSEFMLEFYNTLGIIPVDFKITEAVELSIDDKLYIATLCGGIRIQKAVPLKFDYTINTKMFKMKYLMVLDSEGILYVVPYTESPEEITPEELYNLTEARTIQLQERLSKCVKAYDQSKGITSGFASEILK